MKPLRRRNVALLTTILVCLLTFGYALVRYHFVRAVPLEAVPLYVSNKAIALAATILIGVSFLLGPLARFWPKIFVSRLYLRKQFGLIGFFGAALHVLMSLVLLSPATYAKFYDAHERLNVIGQSSMLFGILAFFIFLMVALVSIPSIAASFDARRWLLVQRLGYLAYGFVLAHVFVMGSQGWLNPESYQYGLISISLIAALVIIFVLLIRALSALVPRKP